jgi:hypothetical protein
VNDRYGLSVEVYLTHHAPQQQRTDSPDQELAAREAKDGQRDHAEAARHATVAAQGDLDNDTDTRHAAADSEEF